MSYGVLLLVLEIMVVKLDLNLNLIENEIQSNDNIYVTQSEKMYLLAQGNF